MEEKKITNGEIKEEIQPVEMPIISVPERELTVEEEIERVEKNIELFNRIKIVSLKLTKEKDWVFQGADRETGEPLAPYLMDRGAENIAIAWGIDVTGVQLRMEWAEDEKGKYYSFIATGKAYAKKLGRYVEDIGVCSQRDRFFGMVGGQLKEIEDIDMANIRRKAVTNLYNRLIKRAVGLMNITKEDLVAAGLDIKKIPVIEYKTSKAVNAQEKSLKQKLEEMLIMMANNDKVTAAKLLEKYSAWKDANGRVYKASSLDAMSERWLRATYGKAKKDFESISGKPMREPGEEG